MFLLIKWTQQKKYFFLTDKGVAEKMIQKPKKTFFSTVDQENI